VARGEDEFDSPDLEILTKMHRQALRFQNDTDSPLGGRNCNYRSKMGGLIGGAPHVYRCRVFKNGFRHFLAFVGKGRHVENKSGQRQLDERNVLFLRVWER